MINWLKNTSGWNELTPKMKQEKKQLVFAYTAGFVTALIFTSLIR